MLDNLDDRKRENTHKATAKKKFLCFHLSFSLLLLGLECVTANEAELNLFDLPFEAYRACGDRQIPISAFPSEVAKAVREFISTNTRAEYTTVFSYRDQIGSKSIKYFDVLLFSSQRGIRIFGNVLLMENGCRIGSQYTVQVDAEEANGSSRHLFVNVARRNNQLEVTQVRDGGAHPRMRPFLWITESSDKLLGFAGPWKKHTIRKDPE
jgi:hypothetical protein